MYRLIARIIPTRVGTSYRHSVRVYAYWDHPHACGDKMFIKNMTEISPGSSPRVWGQVLAAWNTYKNDRIIPTRVGTSSTHGAYMQYHRDHPHACGDKGDKKSLVRVATGSSPRVWGQAPFGAEGGVNDRIIPTRVGTSSASLKCFVG